MTGLPSNPPHNLATLQELGQQLRTLLEANLSKEWDTLERPYPVASIYAARARRDTMDIRDHDFESMVSAYYGLAVQHWLEPYLKLHATLTERGMTSRDEAIEFGNDAYVWACADRELERKKSSTSIKSLLRMLSKAGTEASADDAEDDDDDDAGYQPPKDKVKAIGLETQSRSYIIVLNQKFGRWHLHIRRFWADLREVSKSPYGFLMDEYADRKDLTLEDVVRLAHQAAELYGDAIPGVSYPDRPLLATFLEGDLLAGSESSGIGLRYGDFRDKGYVLSFKNDDDRPEVDAALTCEHAEVSYVAVNLASAICVLDSED